MRNILFYIFFPVVFLFSCQNNWDDHYTQESGNSDGEDASMNLLEYLEAKPDYSEFVKLLKETGVAEQLTRNQVLTVWAPTNATFPAAELAAMPEKDKITLCENHLNYIALYNTKLSDSKLVKSLAGKNLEIKEPVLDQFSIDGKNVVELNGRCTNGVVHEIDGWLIPRKSIYEYIVEAGPEYSIFRDTLLSYNDTIFKPGSSFPLDVDSLGNTIYDSVFVIENPLMSMADLRDEDDEFTLFLPSNAVFEGMYRDMKEYFDGVGEEFSHDDSVRFFRWTLNAVIHKDRIENYTGDLRSVAGLRWLAEKEPVGERENLSNGYIYKLSRLNIPKYIYLRTLTFYPYETFIAHEGQPDLGDYIWAEDGKINVYDGKEHEGQDGTQKWDGRNLLYVTGSTKAPYVKLYFKTVTKDRWGNYIDGKVSSGIYDIRVSWRTYLCKNVKMSVNDKEVKTFNANSASFSYTPGLVIEDFTMPEEWGYNMLTVKFEDVGAAGRLVPEYVVFEPTEDNY